MKLLLTVVCTLLISFSSTLSAKEKSFLVKSYIISAGTQEAQKVISELNEKLAETGLDYQEISTSNDILVNVEQELPTSKNTINSLSSPPNPPSTPSSGDIRTYTTTNCGPLGSYRLVWQYQYKKVSNNTYDWVLIKFEQELLSPACAPPEDL